MATKSKDAKLTKQTSYHVRLPSFIVEEEVGLGDVIKRATSLIGIKPCNRCSKRAASLNQWITFSGRRQR